MGRLWRVVAGALILLAAGEAQAIDKNVAGQKIGAQLISAADGTAFTGAVTVYVTGDAGTQAIGSVGSGACTHEGNGYHTYAPSQAETNYDLLAFTFTGTGAVPVTVQAYTRLNANVTYWNGTAAASASVPADMRKILGTTLTDVGGGATFGTTLAENFSALCGETQNSGGAAIGLTSLGAIKTKTDYLPSATAGAAGGVFVAGTNAATTVNFTGNMSGSVGSVTNTVPANLLQIKGTALAEASAGNIADHFSTLFDNADSASDLTLNGLRQVVADWNDGGRLDLLLDGTKATTDKLSGMLQLDGADWEYKASAVEEAPAGGGGIDWSVLVADIDDVPGSIGERMSQMIVAGDEIVIDTDAVAAIGAQVRTELTPELAFLDVAVSTRLATTGYAAVSADVVGDSYTWFCRGYRATSIVEVESGYEGPLALKPDINPGVAISAVDGVTITGAATVTATGLTVDRSRTRAVFSVPELTAEGTYAVRVEVTTVDGQHVTTTATLKVR